MKIASTFRHATAIPVTVLALGLGALAAAPAQAQTVRPASSVTPAVSVVSCPSTATDDIAYSGTSPNGQASCLLFGNIAEQVRFAPGQQVQAIFSNGFTSTLIMQTDGNLVLRLSNGVTWGSGTRLRGYRAVLQTDGNFVVYPKSGAGIWATNTKNPDGTELAIQSDGNLVAYDELTGKVLWAAF